MSREEFMRQLENLLNDVSEEEKKEALEYYRGYFEDAGEENEERILKELESPEKVAQIIKADLGMGKSQEGGVYTERGYEEECFSQKQEMGTVGSSARQAVNDAKGWKILLIVVAAVFTSPIWVGLLGGLLGGAMGLLAALLGIMATAACLAGAFYMAAVTVVGVGIGELVAGGVGAGTALLGAGFLILALAVLATIACVWLYGGVFPWMIKGVISLCRKLFSGKGRTA